MGLCNLNGQHRWFGLDLQLQSSDGMCRQTQNVPPKHSYPCMYQTIRCPDPDHLINPHHCEHLKSHTKNYSELKDWWKCHVAKTELYKSTIYFFTQYLISHTFSKHCYILHLKKLRKQTVFNINTHLWSGHICWISNFYYNYTTRKLKIKQHIWQWKAKEDCSSTTVPCVILIIWMTVTTT